MIERNNPPYLSIVSSEHGSTSEVRTEREKRAKELAKEFDRAAGDFLRSFTWQKDVAHFHLWQLDDVEFLEPKATTKRRKPRARVQQGPFENLTDPVEVQLAFLDALDAKVMGLAHDAGLVGKRVDFGVDRSSLVGGSSKDPVPYQAISVVGAPNAALLHSYTRRPPVSVPANMLPTPLQFKAGKVEASILAVAQAGERSTKIQFDLYHRYMETLGTQDGEVYARFWHKYAPDRYPSLKHLRQLSPSEEADIIPMPEIKERDTSSPEV